VERVGAVEEGRGVFSRWRGRVGWAGGGVSNLARVAELGTKGEVARVRERKHLAQRQEVARVRHLAAARVRSQRRRALVHSSCASPQDGGARFTSATWLYRQQIRAGKVVRGRWGRGERGRSTSEGASSGL
jgi:hypothetical protein